MFIASWQLHSVSSAAYLWPQWRLCAGTPQAVSIPEHVQSVLRPAQHDLQRELIKVRKVCAVALALPPHILPSQT